MQMKAKTMQTNPKSSRTTKNSASTCRLFFTRLWMYTWKCWLLRYVMNLLVRSMLTSDCPKVFRERLWLIIAPFKSNVTSLHVGIKTKTHQSYLLAKNNSCSAVTLPAFSLKKAATSWLCSKLWASGQPSCRNVQEHHIGNTKTKCSPKSKLGITIGMHNFSHSNHYKNQHHNLKWQQAFFKS